MVRLPSANQERVMTEREGRTVVITGATGGIGFQSAHGSRDNRESKSGSARLSPVGAQ